MSQVGCGYIVGGRLRAPPVADAASNKEWQQHGDWRVHLCTTTESMLQQEAGLLPPHRGEIFHARGRPLFAPTSHALLPPSEREVAFAKQMTEGVCETL